MVEVLPCDSLKEDAEWRRLEAVMETEINLVTMNGRLENQQPQNQQVVLQHNEERESMMNCDINDKSAQTKGL